MRRARQLTLAQDCALRWLQERGGSGAVAKDGVVMACGERAPVTRQTRNKLVEKGHASIADRRIVLVGAAAGHVERPREPPQDSSLGGRVDRRPTLDEADA